MRHCHQKNICDVSVYSSGMLMRQVQITNTSAESKAVASEVTMSFCPGSNLYHGPLNVQNLKETTN